MCIDSKNKKGGGVIMTLKIFYFTITIKYVGVSSAASNDNILKIMLNYNTPLVKINYQFA